MIHALQFSSHLLIAAALLLGVACTATKENAAPSAEGQPSASAITSQTPEPSPTPRAVYRVRVQAAGQDLSETITEPAPSATPAPSPSASATPAAAPSPSPAAGNFFSRAWQKTFPPRVTPTPTPESSGLFSTPPIQPAASPTPAAVPKKKGDGFFTRLWHVFSPPKDKPPAASPPNWIGRVALVNLEDRYVLVDSQSAHALAPGETLTCVSEGYISGTIQVSVDRKPPFFIADILTGKPQVGDRIYSPKL